MTGLLLCLLISCSEKRRILRKLDWFWGRCFPRKSDSILTAKSRGWVYKKDPWSHPNQKGAPHSTAMTVLSTWIMCTTHCLENIIRHFLDTMSTRSEEKAVDQFTCEQVIRTRWRKLKCELFFTLDLSSNKSKSAN